MSSPVEEKEHYAFPAFDSDQMASRSQRRSSDEDGTLQGEAPDDNMDHNHLRVTPSYVKGQDKIGRGNYGDTEPMSPSAQQQQSRRLEDELEMLRAERIVSNTEKSNQESIARSKSIGRSRSRAAPEPVDDFDIGTTPMYEKTKIYKPPANPTTKIAKFFKRIHNSSFLVRYFCYIIPVVLILLIPSLLGLLVFQNATVGGVELFWFGIWLEIVWSTLWAGRILAKAIPWPMGMISSLFTNNSKKWRDLGKALEVPATIFFWLLAVEVSFLPTMINHHLNGNKATMEWEIVTNKVVVSILIGSILNFIEKIIIQLIAISFHLRTYADRIEVNKFQISSVLKLYIHSKEKIAMEDSEFEHNETGPSSGARTPMVYVNKAQKNARHVFYRVGDVAGKVAGDFIGKAVISSTHPHQVILQLLNSTSGAQVLARRLYRTFVHDDSETVLADDLRPAFDNDDEADAAFTMFDKDLNGDISMEELEAVCVEIGRERKAITASLKDLDSVVAKLDDVFFFVVIIITVLVLISLISSSAATALTSLGSAVLALSWLFAATAQEFLQSVIFVFVKHPFDVGDRVTIYGNTGSAMKGDDYFVKEISLLFTEFKKMEGHVVQAPNSYLNTLFILNHRRSGGLAEAVPVTVKFGTTLEQIETLRNRLLEFVSSENREYQKNILTELTTIYEAYSITLNVVFFYKSNWQNELLRLQRRNKFICAMMVTMQELGMEGPRMKLAGAATDYPMYLHDAYPRNQPNDGFDNQSPQIGPRSGSLSRETPFVPNPSDNSGTFQPMQSVGPAGGQPFNHHPSILRSRNSVSSRNHGESISQMGKRVDFSLGMSGISSGADFGDVYEEWKPRLPPAITIQSASSGRHNRSSRESGRHSQEGESLARSSSRDSQMGRVASSNSGRTHRNRFFSRTRSNLGSAQEGTDLEDLEAGTREYPFSEMPDIPEASGRIGGGWGAETQKQAFEAGNARANRSGSRPRRGTVAEGTSRTIDPRTGIVSPQAVASDTSLEREEFPMSLAAAVRAPKRAVTENLSRS